MRVFCHTNGEIRCSRFAGAIKAVELLESEAETEIKFTEDRDYRITADVLEQYTEVYVLSYYELDEEPHERAVWKTDDAIAHRLTRQE